MKTEEKRILNEVLRNGNLFMSLALTQGSEREIEMS